MFYVVEKETHDRLVRKAYLHRGFTADESEDAVVYSGLAAGHGIRTHNAIKALQLYDLFGNKRGGCIPGAQIEKVPHHRFEATEVWNANKKLGQSVAHRAINRCMELADKYGTGIVSVDNAFHYIWGGGYVMKAAEKGYIAYTECTSAATSVVPFGGKYPTLGTNPHSWGFPTTESIGFPLVIDWASSAIAMGKLQQFQREGRPLPPNNAVNAKGQPTTDPKEAVALLPFGEHKGYTLSLMNEVISAFIGGSLPTLRGNPIPPSEKSTATFFFQVTHPDAINSRLFAKNRSQSENVRAVLEDILGHGNEGCQLPGQGLARGLENTKRYGGFLFSEAEIAAFQQIAIACNETPWKLSDFKSVNVELRKTGS